MGKRIWAIVAVSIVIIIGCSVFIGQRLGAVPETARQAARDTSVASLQSNALASCRRSNQQRRGINTSTSGIYQAFLVNANLETALTKAGKDPKRRRLEMEGGQAILDGVSKLRYLPLTDCTASTTHPTTYKLAAPIPWSQHIKPHR